MIVICGTDQTRLTIQSPRIEAMIVKIVERAEVIEQAQKGKVELHFSGSSVSRSVTID